jgi:two-component system OmpR family response regulator
MEQLLKLSPGPIAPIDALVWRPAYRPTEGRHGTRPTSPYAVLRVGPLELDLIERAANRSDREIKLLPREFILLKYMMDREGQVLSRSQLLKEVWNYNFTPQTNTVDVHMGRLRHKVDESHEPPMIFNIRGAGFILRAPA